MAQDAQMNAPDYRLANDNDNFHREGVQNLKRLLVENIQKKVERLVQAESVSEEAKLLLIDEALLVLEKDLVKGVNQ